MDKTSWLNICRLYFICILVAALGQVVHAVEPTVSELELSAIANLDKVALKNDKWHTVLPILGDKNQYLIATHAGKVYQINNSEITQSAVLDLKLALNDPKIIALTAITLDPNFNYRDRDGYHSFYTAHIEASKKNKPKLAPKSDDANVPFDAVVMRWQLTYMPNQAPKLSQQHEVIRIAIQQKQEHIQQLSFNPYVEPWQDDFGLLFIALSQSDALKSEALYAGAILRIIPKKYGIQSYTIPANNPFAKNADIGNEIIFIAGQKTEHFDWIKKSSYNLLVQLHQQDNSLLVQAKIGDDWREAIPQTQIKKRLSASNTQGSTLLYHGRELKALLGKVLHLQETENVWQLQASALSSPVNREDDLQNRPHNLINHHTNKRAQFSLHQKHDGELLLLEHNQQRLYAIKVPETVMTNAQVIDTTISPSNNNSMLAFMFFIISILAGYFWYLRRNIYKKQDFLHEQWANFDVNPATRSLSLYKRHEQAVEQIISITSLTRSELLLNDKVVSIISADSAQAFSNDLESKVLAIFAKEHRLKMIGEKQRKIQLCLIDDQNTRYLFCLYFRVGNIRHTKLKYQQVINKVIDWQWLFAQYINPIATTKRKIKVKFKQEAPETIEVIPAPSSDQSSNDILEDNSTQISQVLDMPSNNHASNGTPAQNNELNNDEDSADLDTKLVSALDKLVMMKKQGYLTDSEFSIAKTKILKDLANA